MMTESEYDVDEVPTHHNTPLPRNTPFPPSSLPFFAFLPSFSRKILTLRILTSKMLSIERERESEE